VYTRKHRQTDGPKNRQTSRQTCVKKMTTPVRRLAKIMNRTNSTEPHTGSRKRPMTKNMSAILSAEEIYFTVLVARCNSCIEMSGVRH
jgi:hypothetical protein